MVLFTYRTMRGKGKMKITNANEPVKEVFDVTGFSDLLPIELGKQPDSAFFPALCAVMWRGRHGVWEFAPKNEGAIIIGSAIRGGGGAAFRLRCPRIILIGTIRFLLRHPCQKEAKKGHHCPFRPDFLFLIIEKAPGMIYNFLIFCKEAIE